MKLLKVEGLWFSRNGHELLSSVQLDIHEKKVTGIVADNQERLEILLSIICGSTIEDKGAIFLKGEECRPGERLRRIGLAQHDVSLVEKLSVLDNIFMSPAGRFSKFGFLRKRLMQNQGRDILAKVGALVPLGRRLAMIEPELKIMVDIARIIAKEPDCFVFNGVTRGMTLRQYDLFLRLIRELKAKGQGVLIVPVNVEDIRNMVDNLYFLKRGNLFEVENISGLSDDDLNDFIVNPGKTHFKAANDAIQRALEMIDAAAKEKEVDFKKISDAVAMSYDNFRRQFKMKIGISPYQYFLNNKIELSKELLLISDLEIKEVSTQLGFSDPYYFSRVFKEKVGVSPVRYRRDPFARR